MDLKNVLREIETYGANIHGGWLLLLVVDDNHNFGTWMPGAGDIHPICFAAPNGNGRQRWRNLIQQRKG